MTVGKLNVQIDPAVVVITHEGYQVAISQRHLNGSVMRK